MLRLWSNDHDLGGDTATIKVDASFSKTLVHTFQNTVANPRWHWFKHSLPCEYQISSVGILLLNVQQYKTFILTKVLLH